MAKKLNGVYVADDSLRHLEKEFIKGVQDNLPKDWDVSESILKCKKDAVNLTFFIYRRAHIMMSHGLADKNYLLRPDAQGGLEVNKYNYVCVPGSWLKNKILRSPKIELDEKFIKVVGWPRIDALLIAQKLYDNKKLTNDYSSHKINVLWAPTHGGGQRDKVYQSSYPALLQHEDQLQTLFSYNRALHPAVDKSKKSTFDKLIEADVVISDKGTLVYEAWALGKPVIFPSWLIREGILKNTPGSAEAYIFEKGIGLHANSFNELIDIIQGQPKVDNNVQSFLNEYLDQDTYGNSYKLIADVVEEMWGMGDLSIKDKVL